MFNEFHRVLAVFIVIKGRCVSPEDNEDNVRMTERLMRRRVSWGMRGAALTRGRGGALH